MKTRFLVLLLVASGVLSCTRKSEISLKLIPVKSGEKWGYVDKQGKIMINPQFKKAWVFMGSLALVRNADDKYGYISEDGKFKINPAYKQASGFSEGLACVVSENTWPLYIDENGKVQITATNADMAGSFNEGLAQVQINKKWGFIDKDGKQKISPQFEYAGPFSDGLAAIKVKVKDDMKWGYIDKDGKQVIAPQFDGAYKFTEGMAVVYSNKKYGYVDKTGKIVVNPQFDIAVEFKNGLALVKQGDSYGYIDKTGKLVINPQFKDANDFGDNGLAAVESSDKKVGYIDKEGKYKINPQFDYGTRFFGDIAFVQLDNKFGTIDKDGKYIANPQFDNINLYGIDGYNEIIESDYFETQPIVTKLLDPNNPVSPFRITASTTFGDVKKMYNLNEEKLYSDYVEQHDTSLVNNVELKDYKITFEKTLYTYETVYKTTNIYGTKMQLFDKLDKKFHYDLKPFSVSFRLYLSKTGKGKAMADALVKELGQKFGVKPDDEMNKMYEKYYESDKQGGGIYLSNGNDLSFVVEYSSYDVKVFESFGKDYNTTYKDSLKKTLLAGKNDSKGFDYLSRYLDSLKLVGK